METFNIGALADWTVVAVGELLTFELPPNGYRRVEFDVIAENYVACRVLSAEDFWTVGAGDGQFSVRFSTSEPVSIAFFGDADAVVMIRTRVETQVVQESGEASFTTIEPRRPGPNDEMRRLMHLQRINAERREALLMRELQAIRGQVAAPPAPVPAEPAGGENAPAA